jgi:uncharacterized flavoprotein (TIGR03862 family)
MTGQVLKHVAIIGGGPAGLMAAEVLSQSPLAQAGGLQIDLYDAMPSVGRKFLLAGIGGLNLTHSEGFEAFCSRFGAREPQVREWLDAFTPDDLRRWAEGLGIATFVGTSGRVFPTDMKAAPLLRAWLHRLRGAGVRFHARHRFEGWSANQSMRIKGPQGEQLVQADAVVLALGGASWARLGSDGAWVPWLQAAGAQVASLQSANCGFDAAGREGGGWSAVLQDKHAGQPVKPVALHFTDSQTQVFERQGEFVLTQTGVEGSLIYAVSSLLREEINRSGEATLHLDLLPQHSADQVLREVSHPRGSKSLSSHLKSRLGLQGTRIALLNELLSKDEMHDSATLAQRIKRLPVRLLRPRPVDEAISTAGGVQLESLTPGLMLNAKPGVFCAGEMLDWEAPTGGYLLTASMASGRLAAQGVLDYLA